MMKQILKTLSVVALAFTLALAGCDPEKPEEKKIKPLDPNAKLSINVRTALRSTSDNPKHLTPLEIVKQAGQMEFKLASNGQNVHRSVSDVQRDIENVAIKMWGTDIISVEDGSLQDYFLDNRNYVFTLPMGDTIAYIPNAVVIEAAKKIRQAYNKGDTDKVYQLFQDAFTALPITASEYKELVKQGTN